MQMKLDNLKFNEALAALLSSHSKLAAAEYDRNPRYNNMHFSHIAEDLMINAMQECAGIEIIDFMRDHGAEG